MPRPFTFFWFRRDLRLNDNTGFYHTLQGQQPVVPVFIFDTGILKQLPDKKDARVEFIVDTLGELQSLLATKGSSLIVRIGDPLKVWSQLIEEFPCDSVYANHDYEPKAMARDIAIAELLKSKGISFLTFKDQVIFEKNEILNNQSKPYTIFTPFKKKWLLRQTQIPLQHFPSETLLSNLIKCKPQELPSLQQIGFNKTGVIFPPKKLEENTIRNYHRDRDFPAMAGTTRLGLHIRFGTVSIRDLVQKALFLNETWLSELIWREFFMMILFHFPNVVTGSFRARYDQIVWNNDDKDFQRWCNGDTGYPLVDAGMRELNSTGFMHNRVRMVTAGFLTKHLLVDWRWGERYFAQKLLDYDLAANNGNWQWAAGTGCDAAPYFRIFNPQAQMKKFDPDFLYVKKWVPEYQTPAYPKPMIDHDKARQQTLLAYKLIAMKK
jgi:deoxyribodipyrimidine photo-lyase